MTPASPHDDAALWAFFSDIAERADMSRQLVAHRSTDADFPPDLKVKAALLVYHLRQAHNEARQLAGPEIKA